MSDHFEFPKMSDSTAAWNLPPNSKLLKGGGGAHKARKAPGATLAAASAKEQLAAIAAAKNDAWVVSEKIHGANLCLVVDRATRTVKFSSRRAWLDDAPDTFFGYVALADTLTALALLLGDAVATSHAATRRIAIFGELFGGRYPHAVEGAVIAAQAVQDEIQYHPGLQFVAFDIGIERDVGKLEFVDYRDAAPALHAAGFLWNRPLAILPFNEAANFSVEFQSTIPALLELPPIEDNWAEGVVVKSIVEVEVPLKNGTTRAMLKIKAKRFLETVEDLSRLRSAGASNEASISSYILQHVNANRIAAAVSKHGKPKAGAAGNALRHAIEQEVFDEVLADSVGDGVQAVEFPNMWAALTDAGRARVDAALRAAIVALLPA